MKVKELIKILSAIEKDDYELCTVSYDDMGDICFIAGINQFAVEDDKKRIVLDMSIY